MSYTIPDNHKGNSLPKSILSDLDKALSNLFSQQGFLTERYAASIIGRCSQGQRTTEFKIHFPTKSESLLAIDHTVIRNTVAGRNVRSTRVLTRPDEVETTLGNLLAEPWTVVKRDTNLGSQPNASSKT